jgi:hypothetical protein
MVMSLMSLRVRYSRLYQAGAKTLMCLTPVEVVKYALYTTGNTAHETKNERQLYGDRPTEM